MRRSPLACPRGVLVYILCLLLFMVLHQPSFVAAAPQALVMETEDERLVRWDLSADSIVTMNNEEILEARGNVYLKRGSEYMKADFARYYLSTKWVYLKGNVIVKTSQDELKAEEAEFDLRSRVGWLTKGQIFMAGPHTYIYGERINKHWGDVYTFQQAKLTTCDGDVPAWSLSADEAVVEMDGYARLTRSSFQVKDVPVMYAPYFIVPTKSSRQTGLLRPEFGKSTTKGSYINQPFFWAINDSSDLTVNGYYMDRRGFMPGIEYRARPSSDTAAWLRFDWMYDKQTKDAYDEGPYADDGLLRTNDERFWLRGMLDTRLGDPNWRLKADLDIVSDQYFLSEFKSGFSGFNRSRQETFDFFRRELQEKDRHRVSGFLLTREWERGSIALSSTYTQNQYLGHGNLERNRDTTVQKLPQADAFFYKSRIFPSLPLEFEASAQAAYMYRRSGTRGARYEMVPKLVLPLTSRYGSIIASAGLRYTLYDTANIDNTNVNDDRTQQRGNSRVMPEFNIAGFTEFAKVYDLDRNNLTATKENAGKSQWVALRHSVQPRLEFRHLPNEYQDDNPYYVPEDRIRARTELVYSLTNVLTAKTSAVVMTPDNEGNMLPSLKTSYRDIARLRVEQAYDFREATRDAERDEYERRPFGDIFAELTVAPTYWLFLNTKNNWSPYVKDFTRHQSSIGLTLPGYGSASMGYDYRKEMDEYNRTRDSSVDYLTYAFSTAPIGPFTLSATFYNDFKDFDNKETNIRLAYNHQCFQLIGQMVVEPQEESYQLFIVLTGLGD